jgi:DNA polymerase-3 subunit alpha
VACLEKDYLEEQGFLKMDLLGLRNLTIVDNCLSLIKESEGVSLAYADIPYEDKDSITLIRELKTMGLFQLESRWHQTLHRRDPTDSDFEDVAAILALFRPGPMESIPSYARRKHGQEPIILSWRRNSKAILKNTYGIIVYQEQIMQIVRTMAGFSYGQADLFRRAISARRTPPNWPHSRTVSSPAASPTAKTPALAEKIYALIYKFADYGFNRSHAVSYAVLTCQMTYLKRHYPKEFYCAIFDSMSPSDVKFKDTMSEIKGLKLKLAVPSINKSGLGFQVDGDSLLFPLSAIKNLQGNLITGLLEEREENGPYLDYFDFASRGKKRGLNLPNLIRLVDAGVFDEFGYSRASLRQVGSAAMNYAEMMFGDDPDSKPSSTWASKSPPLRESSQANKREDLDAEYAALGLMVSGSPL